MRSARFRFRGAVAGCCLAAAAFFVGCASSPEYKTAIRYARERREECRAQAGPVRITSNPNAVNGCAFVGNMTWHPRTETYIKDEAAAMCGNTVFVGARDFEVYRCE